MRYKVVKESVSGHCCFEASVLDTDNTEYREEGDIVCECFGPYDAHKIAEALNEADESPLEES